MEKIPLNQVKEKIDNLLHRHKGQVEEVWLRDSKVGINISVKLFVKDGRNNCAVAISFTKEKIRDASSFPWNEKQIELPVKEAKEGS